jgi:hypothetical protein
MSLIVMVHLIATSDSGSYLIRLDVDQANAPRGYKGPV